MKAGAAGGSGLYPPPPCLLSSAEVSKQSHPRTSFLGIVRKQAPLSEICPVHLSYLKMLIFISENQSLEHYFSASDRYTCSPNQLPTPCKEWWVTYRYIHLKKKKQTEQCLVWNVFKEKASFSECDSAEWGAVLFQNMQRRRALAESEGLRFLCQE